MLMVGTTKEAESLEQRLETFGTYSQKLQLYLLSLHHFFVLFSILKQIYVAWAGFRIPKYLNSFLLLLLPNCWDFRFATTPACDCSLRGEGYVMRMSVMAILVSKRGGAVVWMRFPKMVKSTCGYAKKRKGSVHFSKK
jgi:hypothetical protein